MRALLLAGAVALALVLAPPAAGAGRLDVLAQQLRERPLAVDPELAWFFDAADERRLVRTLRRSPVDVHVALVPQFEDDKSGGDGDRIIASLHRRLRRPGVYVVIDQHGYFDVGSYAVPRRVSFPFDLQGAVDARRAGGRRGGAADAAARRRRRGGPACGGDERARATRRWSPTRTGACGATARRPARWRATRPSPAASSACSPAAWRGWSRRRAHARTGRVPPRRGRRRRR